MASVSVIIPTHNRSALLKQAIESVLAAEQHDMSLEIIVVDDGSTDDTPELVKHYPVVYLRYEGGLGPADARNVGVDAARGDYITFLDDDDLWLPTKLTTQLHLFHEHPEYGMFLAQMWRCDSTLTERWGPYPPDPQPTQWGVLDLLRFDSQVAAVVVRREIAQQIRFDRAFRKMQDWDWFLRVAHAYPVGYTNVPVMLFRGRPRSAPEQWTFYRYTLKVFRHNSRGLSLPDRLRVQRLLWTWRGKYTWNFWQAALQGARQRDYRQAARACWYAVRTSPPHVTMLLAQFARTKITRSGAASASQAFEG